MVNMRYLSPGLSQWSGIPIDVIVSFEIVINTPTVIIDAKVNNIPVVISDDHHDYGRKLCLALEINMDIVTDVRVFSSDGGVVRCTADYILTKMEMIDCIVPDSVKKSVDQDTDLEANHEKI